MASIFAAIAALSASPAQAAVLTWDSDGGLFPGLLDGPGTWDAFSDFWFDGLLNAAWTNTVPNDAVFGSGTGPAGTVALNTPITAHSLTFNNAASGNYSITGAGVNILTLAADGITAPSITTNANATITAVITGNSGMVKKGNGRLILSNANHTYTGGTVVEAGVLELNRTTAGSVALSPGSTVLIKSGGTLELTGTVFNTLGTVLQRPGLVTVEAGGSIVANNSANNAHNIQNVVLKGGTMSATNATDGNNGNFVLGGMLAATGDVGSTISCRVGMNGTLPIFVDDGAADNDLTLSGGIVLAGSGPSMIKLGAGKMLLSGVSTYTGPFTVGQGTVELNRTAAGVALPNLTGIVNVRSGGTLIFSGNQLNVIGTANDILIESGGTLSAQSTVNNAHTIRNLTLRGGSVTSNAVNDTAFGNIVVSGLVLATPDAPSTIGSKSFGLSGAITFNVNDGPAVNDLLVTAGLIGTGSFTKVGAGTVVLAGGNTYAGTTTITGGTVVLDYTLDNTSKVSAAAFNLGANLIVKGAASAETVQSIPATTLLPGGVNLTVQKNGANNTTLHLNTITRTALGGTLNVAYAGSGAGVASATTDNANTNGILGSWATIGGDWAVNSTNGADGVITALPAGSYAANTWAPGTHTNVTASGAPVAGSTTDTLRFNTAGAATLTLSGTNVISTGGLLVGPGVGNNATVITGGTLAGSGTELIVHQHNTANTLRIDSTVADNGTTTALTKTGAGTLVVNGTNTYTGATILGSGILSVAALANGGAASPIGASTNVAGNLVFAGGTLQVTATTSTDRAFTLTGPGTIDVPTVGTTVTVSGAGSGAGALVKSGPGTLILGGGNTFTGGLFVNNGTLELNRSAAPASITGQAIYIKSGATLNLTGTLVNNLGAGCDVTIETGGTLAALNTANNAHNFRNLTLKGGTLTSNAVDSTFGNFLVAGPVVSTSAGASVISSNSFALVVPANGVTNFDVADSPAAKDLTISAKIMNQGGAAGIHKTGDGTMVFTGNNTYTGITTIATGTLQIGDDGTTGTLGTAIVLNYANLAFKRSDTYTVANQIGGTGTLRKQGTGSLLLTAANLYLGPTEVEAGKLFINGSLAQDSAVHVASGATLGGSGTINGPVMLNSGALLESGNGTGTGTLTLRTLALGAGLGDVSTLNLSASLGATAVNVLAPNGLSANGGALSSTINVTSVPGVGLYTLLDYAGTIGGLGFGAFKLGTLGSHASGTLVNNLADSRIELNVTGVDSVVWSGALGSEWSTAVLANPKNWVLNSNNTLKTDFFGGDAAVFNDNGLNITPTISVADVNPSSLTFENNTKAYTIAGTKGIGGSGTLTKNGTATLTINTANSFSGIATINAGTVVLGSPTALGGTLGKTVVNDGGALDLNGQSIGAEVLEITGAGINGTGALINNGAATSTHTAGITVQSFATIGGSGNISQTGVISGGSLTKVGTGTLTLNNTSHTFNGGLIIAEGVVEFNNATSATNQLAGGTTLTIEDGGIGRVIGNNYNTLGVGATRLNTITIEAGGVLTANSTANNAHNLLNVQIRGGTLTSINGVGGVQNDGGFGNWVFNSDGIISVSGNQPSVINASRVGLNASVALPTIRFDVDDGKADDDLTVASPIAGGQVNPGITKMGTGRMVLNGINTYPGPTIINGGTLAVGLSGSLGATSRVDLGGGTLDVSAQGPAFVLSKPLAGNGTVVGSTSVTGTLQPGGVDTGLIAFVGNLSLSFTTSTSYELSKFGATLANDKLTITGALLVDGILTVNAFGDPLDTGDRFDLFDAASISGTFSQVNLPFLDTSVNPNLAWDTSRLYTTGEIRVIPEPAAAVSLLGGLGVLLARRRRKA